MCRCNNQSLAPYAQKCAIRCTWINKGENRFQQRLLSIWRTRIIFHIVAFARSCSVGCFCVCCFGIPVFVTTGGSGMGVARYWSYIGSSRAVVILFRIRCDGKGGGKRCSRSWARQSSIWGFDVQSRRASVEHFVRTRIGRQTSGISRDEFVLASDFCPEHFHPTMCHGPPA